MKCLPYLLIFIFLTTCRSTAQEMDWSLLTNSRHFAGIWVGTTDGTDSLVVVLEVVKSHKPVAGRYLDQLAGQYAYYKSGQLVESSLDAEEHALYSGNVFASEKIKNKHISFRFNSYPDGIKGEIRVSLAEQYPSEGVWTLSHRSKYGKGVRIRIEGKPIPKEKFIPFNIPTKITLRKVET